MNNTNLEVIKKGNFQENFGIDIDCYVLNDKKRTAVISSRGMASAIGFKGKGGNNLQRFIDGKAISQYITVDLREKLNNPIKFLSRPGHLDSVAPLTYGYDVTILIDLCNAVIAAELDSALSITQKEIAKQAHIILNASAKTGIQGLVYALSGYDATKEEVIEAFKLYVQQEAREYEKEFPEQLYTEWYRIYELPKPERNRPFKFMHLTNNHVYKPLAQSNGKLLELMHYEKAQKGDKSKRLHQFLNEIGVKALRMHLGQLLGIAKISKNKIDYEGHFQKVFGQQLDIFEDQ
ncbi:hypothetical protein J7624_07615 [Wohlfahrtiimonas chitiniclastica]|uniref:P63C domain-containing protein n=1 Tax=Wohlfahrtiimonas TaxID=582472 RepID=UPI001313FD5E|nr:MULTISPECIES: P63C domain-containing protein [Wohlfahrtiimonas]MBS7827012.1 hypothetical protein [Wohlfahrtiimonas chitiniclastica]